MKKVGTIVLLLVYASTAFGTVLSFHYCRGRLADISILTFAGKKSCCCNPDSMPKDCCKDELVFKKADNYNILQKYYIINTASFTPDLPPSAVISGITVQTDLYSVPDLFTVLQRSSKELIYLLNRVLRI